MCTLILSFLLIIPVSAQNNIEITRQPQNLVFPEHASAYWNVEATGDDLVYDWFIVYEGVAYNTAKSFVENHPWQEGIVGDGYGQNDAGNEFFIDGIGSALDGAEIYCVISNEAGSVTSQEAHISVSGKKSPPQLTVPASAAIEQDKVLELRCDAAAFNGDKIKSYTWYETTTGELKDIVAIGAKEGDGEENPVLVCNTAKPGTWYYVCYVETSLGGRAYSSVIPVTVTPKKAPPSESSTPSSTGGSSAPQTSSPESAGPNGNGVSQPAANDPGDSEDRSENLPDKTRFSPLKVALAAVGGMAAVGGGITGIIIARKKRSNKKQ